jgi:hypothetical protein
MAGDPEEVPDWLLERIGTAYEEWMPKDLFKAKQVALSFRGREGVAESFQRFANDMLAVKLDRPKRKSLENASKSLIRAIDKYESLICFSLGRLGVKYSQQFAVVPDCYTVTALIGEKTAVDLVGAGDVVAPSGERWTGAKILKNIHLARDGWRLVNPTMRQIQTALEQNSLAPTVADLIAPYSERGAARSSFKSLAGPKDTTDVVRELLSSP